MSKRAWAYIWGVLGIGAVITLVALTTVDQSGDDLLTFLALTVLATAAQLFEAEAPNRQSYYPTRVFQFAAVVLLHPFFLVLLMAIPHLIEWGKARWSKSPRLRAWYIQPFNIATHIIAGLAARGVYTLLAGTTLHTLSPASVVAVLAAALTYASVNHVVVGLVLVLARGVTWRDSGILDGENILTDLVLLLMGFVVAVLWTVNPWLALPALSPLVLIYRALKIPQLKKDAQTDEKTGLWNARHFAALFTTEMERASRFNRPVAVIMADLDLLRNINNTYGHLAGDTVLSGIGQIIRKTIREYDIAGRFGGEEFAIVLPEASPAEAQSIAERLRFAVECASFQVSTSSVPVHATMSLGIACYPVDAILPNDLIHEADVAVYQAKLKGRNCVVMASDVPHSIKLETGSSHDRLASSYAAAYAARPDPMGSKAEALGVIYASSSTPERSDASAPLITGPQDGAEVAPSGSPAAIKHYPKILFPLFVGSVILTGALATLLGFVLTPPHDLLAIALLAIMAVVAEVMQVDVYGANTVAVTTALGFAAALIGGIPGVAIVSTANALGHRMKRESRAQQPVMDKRALYKTAFNWGNHVLAGTATALAMRTISTTLQVDQLASLALFAAIASLAYYAIETGLITIVIGLERGLSFIQTWGEQFRWLAGHYIVMCVMGLFLSLAYGTLGLLGMAVFMLPVLMLRYSQKQYVERTEGNMRELKRLNIELMHANREIVTANQAIRQLNDELFLTLGKIIDARDPYVSGHADKVADYATAIANELGLPPTRVEMVRQAAFLHDIGKIAISEQVLHKPASLTKEEYAYIKTHATLGAGFLETSQGLRRLAPFVRHHHEWYDGTGYPDKLSGEDIPLEARILSVCDAVEAMASDRPYHRALALSEIIAEVRRCAGTQFDPAVVETFVQIAEREGTQLVVNSAREVLRKQADKSERAPFGNEWVVFQENVGNALSTV